MQNHFFPLVVIGEFFFTKNKIKFPKTKADGIYLFYIGLNWKPKQKFIKSRSKTD